MKKISNSNVLWRFVVSLFVVQLLATACSNSSDISEVSDSLNPTSSVLLEAQEISKTETTLFSEASVPSEIIGQNEDVIATDTILRYVTPTTTGWQSGVVVVPNFSGNVWNHVELAAEACRESSTEIENFFECAPAVGKLCYYANGELHDYRMSENRNIELVNALNMSVRVFCFAANFVKTIELVTALSYTYKNNLPEEFDRWLEWGNYSGLRHVLFGNFNFYDINTGNANIESILDLEDALFEYYRATTNGINFEFVKLPTKIHHDDESDYLISDPVDISEFCVEAIYFAKAKFENWISNIKKCLHYSDNYCRGNSFNEIMCQDISIAARNEKLWQDMPVICLQDTDNNLSSFSEDCLNAAISIRDNHNKLAGNFINDYGLASLENNSWGDIFETIIGIFSLERVP